MWFSKIFNNGLDVSSGSTGYKTIIYEIGHSLGLKHPLEDGVVQPAAEENRGYSVMSYTYNEKWGPLESSTMSLYDIRAVQHLDGANTNGNAGDNVFYGDAGNDTMVYNGGNDWFYCGAGIDTVTGFGLRLEYNNISFGNGIVGGQSTSNVENFQFADGRFTTDVNDIASKVFRFYDATLDRALDSGGLRTWAHAVESGMSLEQAAYGFTLSAEFQQKYGAVDTNRNDWFDGGAGRDVVTGFGLRHEYSAFSFGGGTGTVGGHSTAGVEKFVFADGYLVTDTAAQVHRLYGATRGRDPDLGGLRAWTGGLKGGMCRSEIVVGCSESNEHQVKLVGLIDDGIAVYS